MVKAIIWDCYGVLYIERGGRLVRNDELLEYIQSLRPHYKIALLSNLNPGMIDQFFSAEERETFFDAVVVSGDVGMSKPDPAIFRHTCGKLGVEPTETVMVDDVEDYCIGARSAGLSAIRYESTSQARKALQALLK